jgi:tRNA A37 methylthiotransferase MiaB
LRRPNRLSCAARERSRDARRSRHVASQYQPNENTEAAGHRPFPRRVISRRSQLLIRVSVAVAASIDDRISGQNLGIFAVVFLQRDAP